MDDENFTVQNNLVVSLKDFQMPKFNIFDFTTLPIGFTMLNFACRRSGKSHLTANVVHQLRNRFDEVYLFSVTSRYDQEAFNFIPKRNRFDGFDEMAMERIFDDQDRKVQEKIKNPKSQHIKIPRRLIIFDDIISESAVRHSELFNKFFTAGRHLCGPADKLSDSERGDFSIIVSSQTVSGRFGIPAVCRKNTDCTVCFYLHSEYDRLSIADQYCSLINCKIGDSIIKHITKEKYNAIVIANFQAPGSQKYEEYIYRYKAPPKIPKFVIGGKYTELRPPESSSTIKGREKYYIDIPIAQDASPFINNIVS